MVRQLWAGFAVIIIATGSVRGQSLDDQEICAKQAKVAFEGYYSGRGSTVKPVSVNYRSRYNLKLNRCFVSIQTSDMVGNQVVTGAVLIDAFERRIYASYSFTSPEPNKKYVGIGPQLSCVLAPLGQAQTHCSSKDEIDALLRSIWRNDNLDMTAGAATPSWTGWLVLSLRTQDRFEEST
jgi:hypothetical protein